MTDLNIAQLRTRGITSECSYCGLRVELRVERDGCDPDLTASAFAHVAHPFHAVACPGSRVDAGGVLRSSGQVIRFLQIDPAEPACISVDTVGGSGAGGGAISGA
jgi:hypothetical protein